MLLRTLLLFLCVSSGLSATLGLLQIQAKDEDSPAKEATAVVDNAIPAVDDPVSSLSPSVEDPGLLEKLFEADKQAAADKVEVNAPIADGAPAEELVTDIDNTPEEVPVVKAHIQEQPSEEDGNEIKPVQTEEKLKKPETEENSRWSLNAIRGRFQTMHGYFDALVELVGGRDGVCQYRCSNGEVPEPRPGYLLPEPNGCSSSLVGLQVNAALDLGIPAMTQCCNQLDICYDTCGTSKYDCDSSFRTCLHVICSDLKKSLGLGTQLQTCESMADGLFNTVWTLGCRPYMNSQRAACICHGEEKDEL